MCLYIREPIPDGTMCSSDSTSHSTCGGLCEDHSLAAAPHTVRLGVCTSRPSLQAVKSGGKLYLATSTLVTSDKASPTYSRRPAIAWAELGLSAATSGTDTCVQSRAGVASRQAWDPTKDYSIEWSQQVTGVVLVTGQPCTYAH